MAECFHFNRVAGFCAWVGDRVSFAWMGARVSMIWSSSLPNGWGAVLQSSGGGESDWTRISTYKKKRNLNTHPMRNRSSWFWLKFLAFNFGQLRSLRSTIRICTMWSGRHERLDFLEPYPTLVVEQESTLVFLLRAHELMPYTFKKWQLTCSKASQTAAVASSISAPSSSFWTQIAPLERHQKISSFWQIHISSDPGKLIFATWTCLIATLGLHEHI